MPDAQTNVLSYAHPAKTRGRFRLLWAVLPFAVGLLIGGLLVWGLQFALPDFADSDEKDGLMPILALILCVGCGGGYAFFILFIIALASSRARCAGPWWVNAMIGIGYPLLVGLLLTSMRVVAVVTSPSTPLVVTIGVISAALIFLSGIAVPFGLVRWREFEKAQGSSASRRRRFWALLLTPILGLTALGLARRAAVWAFDRDCRTVVEWVKSIRPLPGDYGAIPLPPSQRLLAVDGTIDARILPDGSVLLVVRRFMNADESWSEVIYASSPAAASQIATDAFGKRKVVLAQIPHFVEKQIDSQHFTAKD
jgi:hypothetical protein